MYVCVHHVLHASFQKSLGASVKMKGLCHLNVPLFKVAFMWKNIYFLMLL